MDAMVWTITLFQVSLFTGLPSANCVMGISIDIRNTFAVYFQIFATFGYKKGKVRYFLFSAMGHPILGGFGDNIE